MINTEDGAWVNLVFGSVIFTLLKQSSASFHIDRIEVPEHLRRKGLAGEAIIALAEMAKENDIALSACISPDSDDQLVEDGLARAFIRAGFNFLEMVC